MIKGKIFDKFKKYTEEYLFGFDKNHLQTSFLTGNINLNNVNIRPDKINELFAKKNLPIALKAGLISKLNIKVNLISLFSDSLRIQIEDILFIVGPNIGHMSTPEDFENDINSPYDEQNPLNNLIKMHQKVLAIRKKEHEIEKEKNAVERQKKLEKAREKAKAKASKPKEIKEPPMKIIINLLGGLKLEIKRVHFRYEDDYFQHHKPFSFGLMIESIIMDNSDTDWTFDSILSMGFVRNPPVNSNTKNKELNIKNIKVYWNSMSEMFVPTSLWEQTRHLKFQIFEAMDASFLKEIMVDAFGEKQSFANHYLVAPFTVYTSINLNKSYTPGQDPYKYQINTLISTINANLTPHAVRDILKFQQFMEMFTYCKDLKKFRPLMRVQSFVEQQAYTPQQKKKRAAVIRDWFAYVLWYVRLRRASKGATPYKLLEVEAALQQEQLNNTLVKVKRASLQNYAFEQDSSEDDEQPKSARSETEHDAMAQYEKQQADIKNRQVLSEMLTGFKFSLRLESIKARVYTKKKIKKEHNELPSLEFTLDMLAVLAGIQSSHLVAKVLLKEIRLLDYYKREVARNFSRQANNISRYGPDANDFGGGRKTSQVRNNNGNDQPRGTFAGMQSIVNNIFKRQGSNGDNYNTPDRKGNKLADIIYGNNDRSNMNSRQTPYDFFSLDIPDPSMAQNKTRETMSISDIINNSDMSSRPTSRQVPTSAARFTNRQNASMQNENQSTTPTRGSKIIKAQKFQQSPTKNQERQFAMNNHQLNLRSEIFVDDFLESVDKRCFFLLCGKAAGIDSAITIDLTFNIFDEPNNKKKIGLGLTIDQIIIEYCNEILKSITDISLNYKLAFNFADLKPAKGPSKKNKKRGLQTTVQYQAPLYAIKKLILKKSMNVTDVAIKSYQKKFYMEKEKAKPKSEVMREMKEKQYNTIQKIKKIDKILDDINFDVIIALKNIYLGITGDKDDHFVGSQTLLEFGIENQNISLNKEDFRCKVAVFGISITTLNSFEMLFIFANKLQKVTSMYKDNLAVLISINNYKEFIKNIKQNLEKQKRQKQIEEEKEMMRKSSVPQIVLLNDNSGQETKQLNYNNFNKIGIQDGIGGPNKKIGGNPNQQIFMNQNTIGPNDGPRKNPVITENIGKPTGQQMRLMNNTGNQQQFQPQRVGGGPGIGRQNYRIEEEQEEEQNLQYQQQKAAVQQNRFDYNGQQAVTRGGNNKVQVFEDLKNDYGDESGSDGSHKFFGNNQRARGNNQVEHIQFNLPQRKQ